MTWLIAEYSNLWDRVVLFHFTDMRPEGPGALWMWEIGGDFP